MDHRRQRRSDGIDCAGHRPGSNRRRHQHRHHERRLGRAGCIRLFHRRRGQQRRRGPEVGYLPDRRWHRQRHSRYRQQWLAADRRQCVRKRRSGVCVGLSDRRILQRATSTDGNVQLTLTNDDALTIEARATAVATSAFAYASATLNNAISQSAIAGSGYASNVVANNGTMNLNAIANAIGYGSTLAGHANATADADSVIKQYASTTGTGAFSATNAVDNAGTLNIHAAALASATGAATANAYLSGRLSRPPTRWTALPRTSCPTRRTA